MDAALMRWLVCGVRGQWRVMMSDCGQKIIERDIAAEREAVGILEHVVEEQIAAEAGEDAGGAEADFAGANDADGAAVHVEAEEAVDGEIAIADAIEGFVVFAIEGEHEADGVFGDGVWGVSRDAGDAEAETVAGFEIDLVEAGTAEGDEFCSAAGELLEQVSGEIVVDEGADGGIAGGEGDSFGGEASVEEGEFVRGLGSGGGEGLAVVGFGAEDGDAQGSGSYGKRRSTL